MAWISAGTYLEMSALRSAKISARERDSFARLTSSRERHFIGVVSHQPSAFRQTRVAIRVFRIQCAQYQSWNLESLLSQLHSCELPREIAFAHLLKHFSHLRVLAEEVVHFLHAGA